MVVQHAQAAQNGQVAVAHDVGPLHRERHEHLGRPHADARQRRQPAAHLFVRQVGQPLQIQLAGYHALGRALDVAHLPKRQAELLQFVVRAGGHGLGRDVAERTGQAPPDGDLRLRGYLLAHDAVDQRREQVGRHLAAHRPDSVDGLGQPLVARFQVSDRLLVVLEITLLSHGGSSPPGTAHRRRGRAGPARPRLRHQYNRPWRARRPRRRTQDVDRTRPMRRGNGRRTKRRTGHSQTAPKGVPSDTQCSGSARPLRRQQQKQRGV